MTRISVDKGLLDALVASAESIPEPAPAAVVVVPEVTSKIAWGSKVSSLFRERILWTASALALDPNWLMACMAWETGEKFTADVKNMAGSGATGLIQFMPTTAQELGTTVAKLAAMTAEDQINFVYKYFKLMISRKGPITSLEDCYMAILWPAAIGKPATYALFEKSKAPTAYRQNAGLDSNSDGIVTKWEAASHVRDKLTKGIPLAA